MAAKHLITLAVMSTLLISALSATVDAPAAVVTPVPAAAPSNPVDEPITIPADAPTKAPSGQPSLTSILTKAQQYNTFLRLLADTRIGPQIASLINKESNPDGLTVLAPPDSAFSALKPGTLNGLTMQDQAELILYHVLSKYYSFDMFETTSNPVETQASGSDGVCTMDISTTSSQVKISTGVIRTSITSTLYSKVPLAVYSVDKVLLPEDLFGPNAKKKKALSPPALAEGPAVSADSTSSDSHSGKATSAAYCTDQGGRWRFIVALVLAVAVSLMW